MRYHVSVANRQEGNGDQPHGSQEVTGHVLFVMIPAEDEGDDEDDDDDEDKKRKKKKQRTPSQ